MADGDPLAPIRAGKLALVYFIYGKETYLIERALELLRGRVLAPGTRDFNYELFNGKEADPRAIVSAVRTLPMMAKHRLVIVRDVDEMKATEQAELVSYVSAPVAESCLVLTAEKADQRLKLVAACKKSGVLVKLDPLYERQLPAFLEEEARARGVRFGRGVASLVCNEIGADLGQLADAVERLAIFVGGTDALAGREVTVKDVEEVVVGARQRSVFELAEAVGQGDRVRALTILHALILARESGVRLVAMLARHVRQLWTCKSLAGERLNKFDLAGRLGVAPFFVDGISAQARRQSEDALERMHAALYQTDLELKSSRVDDALLLERLILQLTAAPARA